MSQPKFVLVALKRLFLALLSFLGDLLLNVIFYPSDLGLFLYNSIAPDWRAGQVVPRGHPGFGGKWPDYVPPKEGDSRCSCPALNTLANHGILPHSGRNISFKDLSAAVQRTYNVSSTFSFFVPHYAANMLNRSYWTDALDLSDLDAHNGIEHDASLIRVDSAEDPDQSKIAQPLVRRVLSAGTGPGGDLTSADLSRLLGERRVESKRANPAFSLAPVHRMFASGNASTILIIFGGRVRDLRTFLTEERLPEGWEPRVRHRMGMTMLQFNLMVARVELGIKEEVNGAIEAAGRGRYRAGSLKNE